MTQSIDLDEDDARTVIDAFADGEPVDAPRLVAALASAGDREYFVDLLALRRMVKKTSAVALASAPVPRSKTTRATWWSFAAAVVALAAIGGYAAGSRAVHDSTPAAAAAAPATTTAASAPLGPPPPATEVIRLERGKDWSERVGGS